VEALWQRYYIAYKILIGFIGVYLMMKPELTDGLSWRGLGQAAVLGAAVSYSFAAIFGKRFKDIPAVVNSAGMQLGRGKKQRRRLQARGLIGDERQHPFFIRNHRYYMGYDLAGD
jgi:hypothetical protein